MELDFLPSLGKAVGGALDKANQSFNALKNYVSSIVTKEEEPVLEFRLDEKGRQALSSVLADKPKVPEPKITTPEGVIKFAKDTVRDLPRSAAQITLKTPLGFGQTKLTPESRIEKIIFGEEPMGKPEGAFETSRAVFGTIPFFPGKGNSSKNCKRS